MVDILRAALEYAETGYSVIPITTDLDSKQKPLKKSLVPWTEFQKRKASTEEIRTWWQKWPDAMIGIVTGEISNLFVIDCDTEEGFNTIQEHISDSLTVPIVRTPRGGWHLWFTYPTEQKLTVGTNVFPHVDFRGEGGYCIVPPSINGNGKAYRWQTQVSPASLPLSLINALNIVLTNSFSVYGSQDKKDTAHKCPQVPTSAHKGRVLSFDEPGRDDTLFHVANSLYRSGMPEENVRQVIERLAFSCNPPFPEKELEIKLKSVLQRAEKRERPITEEVKDFLGLPTSAHKLPTDVHKIEQVPTTFRLQDIYTHLHLSTREDKKAVQIAIKRLEGKVIERTGSVLGTYKILNQELNRIDLKNKSDLTGELFIKFPLNIHEFIKVMPRCIYIISGEPDSGKSGYLMSFAKRNSEKHKIHYFSSEMGKSEFLDRLQYFWPDAENDSNMNFYERSEDFDQVIFPDDINIIDYMTLYDNFYLMAGLINAIGKKLKKGIAFIALQKPPGRDSALGGDRTKDLARLYLALSYQQMKIIKAKNWRNPKFNPNRLTINYEIWEGWDFKNTTPWQKEVK